MTGGLPPNGEEPALPVQSPTRPGVGTFTIEGRAAPGLFVAGWLATIIGFGLILVGAMASSGPIYFVGFGFAALGLLAGAGNQALERRARGAAYAGPSPFLVVAVMFVTTIAIGAIVGIVLSLVGGGGLPRYAKVLLGVSLQSLVYFGVIRLTVVGTGALSWREMGWSRFDRRAVAELASGAMISVPVIGLTLILAAVLVSLVKVQPVSPLPPTGETVGLFVNLLAGAIIAPFAEEAVFRGFAQTAWERAVGLRPALVRASLLFAFAHIVNVDASRFDEALGLIFVGFAVRLPVAVALGWLFIQRRTIWAPIGLHLAFNAIQIVLSEVARGNGAG